MHEDSRTTRCECAAAEDADAYGLAGTRWERWFGDPWKAAESVTEISDYYESLLDEIQGRGMSEARGFAAAATGGGERPWGLGHVGDLVCFLEKPYSGEPDGDE